MNFARLIDLSATLDRKSCFLLGPRQTGKSWIVRNYFPSAKVFNLLDSSTFRSLSRRPEQLGEELSSYQGTLAVIDEIQLLPELLNDVHLLIEEKGLKFLLTGSSARKLRRAGTNLLGGRATWKELHPLVRQEVGSSFNLNKALTRGLLPAIYNSASYLEDLKDYVEIYLREEIANETAIRQIPTYSRFLDVAALCNSQVVNYSEVGSDAQISPSTVREYFHVLQDTLLISRLPAWQESKKRKAASRDKYYFFDIGVVRYLQGRTDLVEGSKDFGEALETYVYHELKSYLSYKTNEPLYYWRSAANYEVDFILSDHTAIEVKATRHISGRHLRSLKALQEEGKFKRLILVSLDNRERTMDGIRLLPVMTFLDELWDERFV